MVIGLTNCGIIGNIIQNGFREASENLLKNIPMFETIEKLTNNDVKIKDLYKAYKTYKKLSKVTNFNNYIKQELENIGDLPIINISQQKSSQKILSVLMPWIQANEFNIKAKKINLNGNFNYNKMNIDATNNINITSSEESILSQTTTKGLSLNINSIGINCNESVSNQINHVHSMFNGNNTIINGKNINLKGVYIKTLKAIINAETLHLETMQNKKNESSNSWSINISKNPSGSISQYNLSDITANMATEINASESIIINASKELVLIGAKITGKGTIKTPEIKYNNTYNFTKSKQIGVSIGENQCKISYDRRHKESTDLATISKDIDIITESNIDNLNRNETESKIITRDDKTKFSIDIVKLANKCRKVYDKFSSSKPTQQENTKKQSLQKLKNNQKTIETKKEEKKEKEIIKNLKVARRGLRIGNKNIKANMVSHSGILAESENKKYIFEYMNDGTVHKTELKNNNYKLISDNGNHIIADITTISSNKTERWTLQKEGCKCTTNEETLIDTMTLDNYNPLLSNCHGSQIKTRDTLCEKK